MARAAKLRGLIKMNTDLDAVMALQDYARSKFTAEFTNKPGQWLMPSLTFFIERGDDCASYIQIDSNKLRADPKFVELLDDCRCTY
jgi:hypothetical protein